MKRKLILLFAIIATIVFAACAQNKKEASNNDQVGNKILFVVTSHETLGDTDKATGYHLGEVTHPWSVLHTAGYEIDFVSPKGGNAPVTSLDLDDPINKAFWEDSVYRHKIENTLHPSEVKADDYQAIYYAGGHGTMWDFADNEKLASIAATIYENKGIVGAVCHGPAGLVNIKLSDDKYLVNGIKINSFTNAEESAIGLDKVVPFLLEDKLVERGAIFENSGLWEAHVVTDKRVVTGQNPQSAKAVGEAILKEIEALNKENSKL